MISLSVFSSFLQVLSSKREFTKSLIYQLGTFLVLASFLTLSPNRTIAETTSNLAEFNKTFSTANPFYGRLSNFINQKDLLPSFTNKDPFLSFNINIPGYGRAKIHLTKSIKTTLKFYTSYINENSKTLARLEENPKINLYRGFVKLHSGYHYIAASSFYLQGTPYLIINLLTRNSRFNARNTEANSSNPARNAQKSLKLQIRLDKQTQVARIHRAQIPAHKHFEDDQLHLHQHHQHSHHSHIDTANLELANSINTESLSKEETTLRSNLNTGNKTIRLRIDADNHWFNLYKEDSHAILSSFINEADVIYQNQLGITLKVVSQNVFTSQSFGTNNAIDRLCNYQYFTSGSSNLTFSGCVTTAQTGPQDYYPEADAYHLFTGEALDTSTIGLAFVGSICSSPENAFGLTQLTSIATTPITFAHELAHNLAAIHDNSSGFNGTEFTSCPSTNEVSIMNAYLSWDPPKTFSDCSLSEIQKHLSRYGSCLNQEITSDGYQENPEILDTRIIFDNNGTLLGRTILAESLRERINENEGCQFKMNIGYSPSNLESRPLSLESDILSNRIILYIPINRKIIYQGTSPKLYFKSKIECNNAVLAESNVITVKSDNVNNPREISFRDFIVGLKNYLSRSPNSSRLLRSQL